MGKTFIERIIQAHTRDEVHPGKIVWMDLDIMSARDFGGPNVVKNFEREYAGESLSDKSKTFFTFDLSVPATMLKYADNQQICREFARKHGIRVFDVDRGIGSHVLMEEGLAVSSGTVVGTDSHMNILGAVGCFGQGMGDVDIAFAFKTGRTWFEVPETLKVTVTGRYTWPTSAKDLTLYILKKLGTDKGALKSIEFYGEAVRSLSLAGRITLCSMVTEMAGIIGFVPEHEGTFSEELAEFSGVQGAVSLGEAGTVYADALSLDVSQLPPQVASPFSPTNVNDIHGFKEIRIDSGFIGSCTNGRIEDFREAAKVCQGKKIKDGVMLKIVPATKLVYQEMLQEGILDILFGSGAIISNPGCGGCAEGHMGLTGKGEVQISTGNRNFSGKQGKGMTYLASPAVVAASCIAGRIVSPEDL
ncbi:MAG: 3-isopropylmalate dehydratase large subunit [Candidatus Aminicenantes bacterium]|nr:3-isopropylmalate dehydratase large subunit [Candidatus Aminicenantes bacterium]